MDEQSVVGGTPLMTLREIKACGHLLLGTLQLRCEQHGSQDDPRKEMISARVFVKKRLKELPVTDDKNDKNYVLRSLYQVMDVNYEIIFSKIGQVSGELAFLSTIHDKPEFESVELQFIWTCNYLFNSGQLEEQLRGDFHVPKLPEFEMPIVDEIGDADLAAFALESENELRRQLENYLTLEEHQPQSSVTIEEIE